MPNVSETPTMQRERLGRRLRAIRARVRENFLSGTDRGLDARVRDIYAEAPVASEETPENRWAQETFARGRQVLPDEPSDDPTRARPDISTDYTPPYKPREH